MLIIKPVAYCVLDEDYNCKEIAYGKPEDGSDVISLYDQYVVERLCKALEQLKQELEYHRSQTVNEEPVEAPTPVVEHSKDVIVKFKDGHKEQHKYSHTTEEDNATIIKQVVGMFPKNSVANVLIMEK